MGRCVNCGGSTGLFSSKKLCRRCEIMIDAELGSLIEYFHRINSQINHGFKNIEPYVNRYNILIDTLTKINTLKSKSNRSVGFSVDVNDIVTGFDIFLENYTQERIKKAYSFKKEETCVKKLIDFQIDLEMCGEDFPNLIFYINKYVDELTNIIGISHKGYADVVREEAKERARKNTKLTEKDLHEIDLASFIAENKYDWSNIPTSNKSKKEIMALLNGVTDFHSLNNLAIALCKDKNNKKVRYILATSYASGKADKRKDSIYYIKEYIDNGFYEKAVNYNMTDKRDTSFDAKYLPKNICINIHIADMYSLLGKAYEGEHMFNEALEAYTEAFNLNSMYVSNATSISRIYMKMNQLDKAISFIQDCRKLDYFKPFKYFNLANDEILYNGDMEVLDQCLNDYLDKRNKGYIYRPRNNKTTD